jgi:hypothetical protein
LQKAQNRLREIKKLHYDDLYLPPVMTPLAQLMIGEAAWADALQDQYPTVYLVEGEVRYEASSLDEMIKVANEIITSAEWWSLTMMGTRSFECPLRSFGSR